MKSIVRAAVATIVLTGCAYASPFTISSSVGGAPTGVSLDNLNWLPLGSGGGTNGAVTVTFVPDAGAVQGALSGQYAAPFYSNLNGAMFGDNYNGADQSTYITSGSTGGQNPGAGAAISFSSYQKYFGLLWGSVDGYNTLSFYDGNTLIGSVTGAQASLVAPTGDQGANGTYYVNIVSDTAFNKVVATSSSYAFEFDNIAYNPTAPVPEPGSLALVGLAAIGLVRRLRR